GAVTSLSLLYFAIGTITLTDMPLSLFLTAALSAFYYGHIKNDRRWFLAFYASVALGLLAKGLVAIVLPGGIIFWYIIFTKKWRLILDALYLPGIALFFIIAFPWFYMVSRENPDFLYFFFMPRAGIFHDKAGEGRVLRYPYRHGGGYYPSRSIARKRGIRHGDKGALRECRRARIYLCATGRQYAAHSHQIRVAHTGSQKRPVKGV
ncbi:MAG: hypothetical protein CVV42_21585, partial [Candidatus Riflebacteria bacterium HGW-Riflebacteria-2]